jgi:DNA primase
MIARSTVQKVIDTADVVDVVGNFVTLKKRGANQLGLCPFHNEKTPSFTVSPAKGIYKCFGCGKAGNSVTFIQEHEQLSFPEAIKWLAKLYHIEVEEKERTPEEQQQQKEEESLRIVNEFAQDYFHNTLKENTEGQQIGLSYFKERGFVKETIDTFKLGYSPENRQAFSTEATAKGYDKNLLITAGLVGDRNGSLFDKYSGRVIFPIQNQSGKTIGFGARILKSNTKAPKYINTPENPIYHKSKTLYGIFQAKRTITQQDECFLVEGYTDVISLYQGGVQNVVASSGTSLTEGQLYLLKRYTKNLTILYDGDTAGVKAALRGMDIALEVGLNVKLVLLPENHDPDSFMQENGVDGFKQFVAENKKDFVVFKLEASLKEAQGDNLKKSQLINDIAETISKINKIEEFSKQQDYIRRCAQLLQIEEAGLVALVNKKIRVNVGKKKSEQEREELKSLEQEAAPEIIHEQEEALSLTQKDYKQEQGLIRILMQYGNREYDENNSVSDYVFSLVQTDDFINKKWKQLFSLYKNMYEESLQFPELKDFTHSAEEGISQSAIEAIQIDLDYEPSKNWKEMHKIDIPTRDETFIDDVEKTVDYFYLRKIKAIYKEHIDELKDYKPQEHAEEIHITQQTILEIKNREKEILQKWKIASIG